MEKRTSVRGRKNRHLPAFILLFLADKDAHGGSLWSQISSMMPDHQDIDSGAVYRVLRDLEERGCVTSYWNTEDSGPAKRIYHVTEHGMEELQMCYTDICVRKKNLEYFIEQYQNLVEIQVDK